MSINKIIFYLYRMELAQTEVLVPDLVSGLRGRVLFNK